MQTYLLLSKVVTVVGTGRSADVHEGLSEARGVALSEGDTHVEQGVRGSRASLGKAFRDALSGLVHLHGTTSERVGQSGESEERCDEKTSSHHLDFKLERTGEESLV